MKKRSTAALAPLVDLLGRRLSTATILFHAAVADELGVSVTDAKCRSILVQAGPMTAGDLALRLGLTTGAVTGVIDRLERARLVRRAADPADRRRVIVEPVPHPKRDAQLARLFQPMGRRVVALAADYRREDQATIAGFLTRACEILEEETARLRAAAER